jgi:CubicO group peptidase (beta-lactamase class C family)
MYQQVIHGLLISLLTISHAGCNDPRFNSTSRVSAVAENEAISDHKLSRRETRRINRQIDKLLVTHYPVDKPGASVIVVKDGQILFRGSYGLANVELDTPIEPSMVFNVGSLSKPFLAVGIMMLVEQDQLSLDDKISTYLPDYPNIGEQITVRQLLSHTSGLKHYNSITGYSDLLPRVVEVEELVDFFKNEPLDFKPGEKWQYSNSGYVLLGMILEKVSGIPYEDFLQKNIFDRLKMNHTYFSSDQRIIPGKVAGYHVLKGEIVLPPHMSMSHLWAAGALITSVDDLSRWDAALSDGQLLDQETYTQLFSPFVLNSGKESDFTLGWEVLELHSRDCFAHGGGIFGYVCHTLRIPEERLYVALLSNRVDPYAQPGTATLAELVAALALGESIQTIEKVALEMSDNGLEIYAGQYRITGGMGDGAIRRLVAENGHLFYTRPPRRKEDPWSRFEILPESPTTFFAEGRESTITFDFDEQGEVLQMAIHQPGGRKVLLVKQCFTIQLSAWDSLNEAQTFVDSLQAAFGYDAYVQESMIESISDYKYRVRIGQFDSYEAAQFKAKEITNTTGSEVWVTTLPKNQQVEN